MKRMALKDRQSQVRWLDFSERGTPEERTAHSIAVYESLGNARKRANAGVLGEA